MSLVEEYLQKEKELRELELRIQQIYIHPGVWSNVAHDQKKYLKGNGWTCVNTMVPVESWHGFGSIWMKDCSEGEKKRTKNRLDEIEEYLTTNDNE